MFSNGNFFILLILLKYMSFTKFLLAENSTNINYKNYNYHNNYSAILNENITNQINTIKSKEINLPNNSISNNKKSLHMATVASTERYQFNDGPSEINNNKKSSSLDELFLSDASSYEEDDFQPKVEPLVSATKYNGNGKRGRQQERLQQPPTGLPVFPERPDAVYFIVAVIGGAKQWGRILARTLLDMGPPFGSSMGPPLRPLYVDLPPNGRFSVKVLTSLCQQSDGIPLAGIIVIGDGQSARAVALSGNSMNVPVLWAKGGTANVHGIQREGQSVFQSMLQPSANEILAAIRALFLQTNWHSFFVLSDVGSTIVLASNEGRPLKEPPLVPTILPLPAGNGDVFRQLAQISRSTRGIILLLCDLVAARRIMLEARRLNMDGGHFIWLWADTSSTTEFFDFYHTNSAMEEKVVVYPEAVKQFVPPSTPNAAETNNGDSFPKHLDDLAEHKTDFDDLDTGRRRLDTKISDKSRTKPQLKHQYHHHQQQQQQQQQEQESRQHFRNDPFSAGRYIFGLNRNSEESNEVKVAKEKRNPYKDFGDDDESLLSDAAQSYEDSADLPRSHKNGAINKNRKLYDNFQSWLSSAKTKNYHSEESTNIDLEDYTAERFDNNENGSEADSIYNRNVKPKRTSSYYVKNSTKPSHVLFHNFKDFPIGLLALRPVRMPVDRHFIRSTIRLFASTWSKVDREVFAYDYDVIARSRYRPRDRNSYLPVDDRHDRRSISKTSQQPRRRKNSILNNRNRKRRSNADNTETVNTKNQMDIKRSAIINFPISNENRNFDDGDKNNNNRKSVSGKQSSDLNDKLLIKNIKNNINSSYNQNLSGLTNPIANNSNNGSNILSSSKLLDTNLNLMKTKRYNTWWSAKDIRQHQPTIATSGPGANSERYRKGSLQYKGGCFGTASRTDIKKAQTFSKALKEATTLALSGQKLFDGSLEKPLTTNFELLNLVPDDIGKKGRVYMEEAAAAAAYSRPYNARHSDIGETMWRHVGSISGTNVELDTIVWPGGDIVVSGLSVQSRTIFRIVTALAPPFVMESEQEEHGLCLRGLPCHRLSPTAEHNLTLMFNAIETRDRFEEDAIEHGIKTPPQEESSSYDHSNYKTKCCYGLSMDLLENIAVELNFEFHLYIVHDELFGRRRNNFHDDLRQKDSEFWQKGQIFWNEKHKQLYHKDQSLNRRSQQAPLGGSNYYSASFERKFNLNTDSDLNEEDERLNKGDNNVKNVNEEATRQTTFESSRDPNTRRNAKDSENKDEERRNRLYLEKKNTQWNGVVGDLLSGYADMSFAPLSVTKARAEAIDFSVPYFHSGVSLLAAPTTKSEIPLLAFLLPFSPELWIAIFTSLNVTAIAVAIYEWLSPFGLNPWGRQRSKNFSMSSALWVMWGLLCGHLVAFKAPKSWPNKFLINVWGGFSVIFIASYTANIAALIAGLFFHNASNRYDVSLLTQRVGAPTASAAESYVQKNDHHLWEHMKKYTLNSIEDGIRGLKNGTLDLIMADTPILDYYRATDHGCNLQRIGDTFVEDTYAIAMTKGFPLKDSISALIAKYSSNGYLDILTEKWYGGLPCFKLDNDIVQPRPLGVEAVAGVFLLLGLGMILGLLILIFEHMFYKYTLPILRHKPKGTVWKSRNIMFFSQKLYRFINCVELVSPHHAARELVHTLRQGQIASLFQKSIKRKEDEQRRRRKSKAQFFEMIQEIRRVQQQERNNPKLEVVTEVDGADGNNGTEAPVKPKSSPIPRLFSHRKDSRSRSNSSTLNVRRFSTDSILSERMDTIGRRLSRDLTNSPPDFGRRFESFGKNNASKFDTFSGGKNLSSEKIEETKFDTYSGKDMEKPPLPAKKFHNRRTPLNSETFSVRDRDKSREDLKVRPLPVLKEGLVHPICQEDSTKAVLRDRLHEELRSKYGDDRHAIRMVSSQTNAILHKGQSADRAENQHHRQRSLDGIESRPPMPSPRHSYDGFNSLEPPALPPKVSPRTNLTHVSLDRLSREDLLKLSESSQSEIHDYLNKSKTGRPSEPP